jgi:hypothetical protein
MRNGFATDQEYLCFVQDHITQTVCRICLTTTHDSWWKPINHHILLECRHDHPAVRRAAILSIKTLFQEVNFISAISN